MCLRRIIQILIGQPLLQADDFANSCYWKLTVDKKTLSPEELKIIFERADPKAALDEIGGGHLAILLRNVAMDKGTPSVQQEFREYVDKSVAYLNEHSEVKTFTIAHFVSLLDDDLDAGKRDSTWYFS